MTDADAIETHSLFNDALLKRDLRALAEIYADDYMLVRPDGSVLSKLEVLDDLEHGGLAFHDIQLEDVSVRIHGETAVLTAESRTVASRDGKETRAHARLVAVYAQHEGRVRLVHFQSVILP